MADRQTNSDEQPIRTEARNSRKPVSANTANDEEPGTSNHDACTESGMDKEAIWKAEKNGEGYYVPVHVWFATIVFPLFAGSFGPMSAAFAICALAEPWRIHVASQANISNPRWLVVLVGLSLALLLLANISLLLSMINRLPFKIAQLFTVPSFLASSILLILSTTLASHNLLPNTGTQELTSPFYFACISAGVSLIIAMLLMYTVYLGRIRRETPQDLTLTLTLPQRTLMAQSLGFIIFLNAGAGIFAAIEGWKFTDSVYWATITLLTIGFGDIVPVTHAGRTLIIFYATAGIVSIGLVIGSIARLVLDRGAKKMFARKTVDARTRQLWAARPNDQSNLPLTNSKTLTDDHLHNVHLVNEKAEFNLMRQVQEKVSTSQQRLMIMISLTTVATLWLLGAVVFWQTEKASQSWTYFDAIYFCFISLLTIGYGDLEVKSEAGRPFFVFWSFLAVPTMTILIASAGATFLFAVKAIIHKIDEIVVLPHEGDQNSYTNKAQVLAKLQMKANFGHWIGKDRHEKHWHPEHGEGVRNPDTGVVHHDHRVIHKNLPAHQQLTHATLLFQLAREIRALLAVKDSDRKYTYEEWTKYIHLLNHDARDSNKKNQISRADWSWLDDSSPLFRGKNETAWILERLSRRLEEELGREAEVRDEGKGILNGDVNGDGNRDVDGGS